MSDPIQDGQDETCTAWIADPRAAFRRWKSGQRLNAGRSEFVSHSISQYTSMWSVFCTWMEALPDRAGRRVDVSMITAGDIDRFVLCLRGGRPSPQPGIEGGSPAVSRPRPPAAASTARRYLFLIHHAFEHMREVGLLEINPCAELPQMQRHQAAPRPAKTLLLPRQEADYIRWCADRATDCGWWEQSRNRALRLLLLASGLTVGEARRLKVTDIDVECDGHGQHGAPSTSTQGRVVMVVRVGAYGRTPAHATSVAPFAVEAMADWLEVRRSIGAPGELVFNASRSAAAAAFEGSLFGDDEEDFDGGEIGDDEIGGILDEMPQSASGAARTAATPGPRALSAKMIYDIVAAALKAVGYEGHRFGPATLRNAFIARQIRHGRHIDVVRDWCGLYTIEPIRQVQRQVPVRPDAAAPDETRALMAA